LDPTALTNPIFSAVGSSVAPKLVATMFPQQGPPLADGLELDMKVARAQEFLSRNAVANDPGKPGPGIWAGCVALGLLAGVAAGRTIFGAKASASSAGPRRPRIHKSRRARTNR
jgi:hypothetical protein